MVAGYVGFQSAQQSPQHRDPIGSQFAVQSVGTIGSRNSRLMKDVPQEVVFRVDPQLSQLHQVSAPLRRNSQLIQVQQINVGIETGNLFDRGVDDLRKRVRDGREIQDFKALVRPVGLLRIQAVFEQSRVGLFVGHPLTGGQRGPHDRQAAGVRRFAKRDLAADQAETVGGNVVVFPSQVRLEPENTEAPVIDIILIHLPVFARQSLVITSHSRVVQDLAATHHGDEKRGLAAGRSLVQKRRGFRNGSHGDQPHNRKCRGGPKTADIYPKHSFHRPPPIQ